MICLKSQTSRQQTQGCLTLRFVSLPVMPTDSLAVSQNLTECGDIQTPTSVERWSPQNRTMWMNCIQSTQIGVKVGLCTPSHPCSLFPKKFPNYQAISVGLFKSENCCSHFRLHCVRLQALPGGVGCCPGPPRLPWYCPSL